MGAIGRTWALTCAAAMIAAAGCDRSSDIDMHKPAHFGFQTSMLKALEQEGEANYQLYCVGCHGVKGDGKGEAAPFLNPRPRDFVTANFKFSSTRSGQIPLDDDLKRTIRNGLRGSAMPSFPFFSDKQLDSLIAYIKRFSPTWKERDPSAAIPIDEDPFRSLADKSEAIIRGEALYHGYNTCWNCHPSYVSDAKLNEYLVAFGGEARPSFRPMLHQSEGKKNAEGELIFPPDFLRDHVKAGTRVEDLYRSVAAGITGTAMPTWVDSMNLPGAKPEDKPLVKREDLWALAYYVQSLIEKRPALMKGDVEVRVRPRPIYLHGEPPPEPEPGEAEVGEAASEPSGAEPAASQPADTEFDP